MSILDLAIANCIAFHGAVTVGSMANMFARDAMLIWPFGWRCRPIANTLLGDSWGWIAAKESVVASKLTSHVLPS